MRYIKFTGGNNYCGCDIEEYVAFSDDTDDVTISQYAAELAEQNGETFEYVASGWGEGFETEEDRDYYYENCWCEWEEISKEEFEENTK